jgi:hypothetical protein
MSTNTWTSPPSRIHNRSECTEELKGNTQMDNGASAHLLSAPNLSGSYRSYLGARYTTGVCAVKGVTLQAPFCLAFAAFLRIREITYSPQDPRAADFPRWFVTNRSVQIHTSGGNGSLSLTLPASKTDPFRKSVTILVTGTGDIPCPVKAIGQYLRQDQHPANSPLFVTPGNLPFTCEYLIIRLRTLALSVGLGAEVWNGHSFRRGAATWANLQGLPGDTIQLLGR